MKSSISRRDLLRYVAAGGAGMALAACQPSVQVVKETVIVEKEGAVQAPPERRPVVWWHFDASGARRDAYDVLTGKYNLQSDRYAVQPSYVDFGALTQKLVSAIAAGGPPDVTIMTGMTLGSNVVAGQLTQLDTYIDASGFPWDQVLEYGRVGCSHEGKRYGIPLLPDTRFLFINSAAVREVGLDPMQPPKTWDELVQWAAKLDKGAPPDWERVGFCPMWGNCWVWTLAWNNGVEQVDDNNNITLNSPQAIEVAYFYKERVEHYGGKQNLDAFATAFGAEAQSSFMSGLHPVEINGSWTPGNIRKYAPDMEVDFALCPQGPSSTGPGSWGCGHPFVIPAGAPNADGGWDFINFMCSFDSMKEICLIAGQTMGRIDVNADPEIMASWKYWPTAAESLIHTRDRKFVEECQSWAAIEMDAIREVWDAVKTPEEALNDAQARVEQEIANWRATHG